MEALMSAQVISLLINGLEEATSHPGQAGSDADTEEPGQRNWQHEDGEEAIAERSDSDDLSNPSALTAHLHLSCSEAQVVRSFSWVLGLGLRSNETGCGTSHCHLPAWPF